MPRSFFDDRALVFDEGTFDEVPDVEGNRPPRSRKPRGAPGARCP